MEPVLSRPGEGELIENEQRKIFVKGSWEHMAFLEYEGGPAYEGAGPHFHKLHVDSFYVLEGELQFWVGDETHRAGPGTFVAVPPGIIHAFTNPGPGSVRFLNVHAPSCGFTDYIRAVNSGEEVDAERFDMWNTEQGGPAGAVVLVPGEGELFSGPRREIYVRYEGTELEALEFHSDPGFGPIDPHVHDDHTDSFYVLGGEIEFTLGDEIVRAGPGTFVAAPRGARHGFAIPGPDRAHFLNVHAPGAGFIGRVRSG
jgi:quercetin dioxygenase-like cupin family protein